MHISKAVVALLAALTVLASASPDTTTLISGSLSARWTPAGVGSATFVGDELRLDNRGLAGQTFATTTFEGTGISPDLDANPGLLQWSFNMRNLCPDGPSDLNRFGITLAATDNDLTKASGLAVVVGNNNPAGTPADFPRLIHFQNGIGNSDRWFEIASGGPDTQKPTDYLSIRVTYDPPNDLWNLYGSKTYGSYSNPLLEQSFTGSGTFCAEGTFQHLGVWSLHTTGGTQDRSFANLGVDLIPEPVALFPLFSGLFLLLSRRTRVCP